MIVWQSSSLAVVVVAAAAEGAEEAKAAGEGTFGKSREKAGVLSLVAS